MDYIAKFSSSSRPFNYSFDKEHKNFLNYIDSSKLPTYYYKLNELNFDEQEFYRACFNGDFESASMMLKMGVNLNKRFDHGRTLLHIACIKNFYGLVKLLIKFGCNEYIKDSYLRTALHYVAMAGSDAILKYLIERNTFNFGGYHGSSASSSASNSSRSSVSGDNDDVDDYLLNESHKLTKEFLNLKDIHGKTALYYACERNHVKCVEYILRNTNNLVNVSNEDYVNHQTELDIAYEKQYWDIFELLIKYGSPINASMLREICSKGNLKLLNILLRYNQTNIDWFQLDENSNTPAYFSFKYSFNFEFIKRLVENNIYLNINDLIDFINDIKQLKFESVNSSQQSTSNLKTPQDKFLMYIEYLILMLKAGNFNENHISTLTYTSNTDALTISDFFSFSNSFPSTQLFTQFNSSNYKYLLISLLDSIYQLFTRCDQQTQSKASYRILYMFALAIYSKQLNLNDNFIKKWLLKLQKQIKHKSLLELFNDALTTTPFSLQMLCRCTIRNSVNIKELKDMQMPSICMKYLQFDYI